MEVESENIKHSAVPDVGNQLVKCPNCVKQLKASDVAQHCEEEMEELQRMQLKANDALVTVEEHTAESTDGTEERRKPWSVFQKVKRNRHFRLKLRTRKRVASISSVPTERSCPVCDNSFPQDEIEEHVESCLKRSKMKNGQNVQSSSDEEDIGEEYEEYEWAGQKRIRVSTMLQGGYAAHGIGQTIINSNGNGYQEADDEEDLNVDEDDTHIYGPPQYAESDIISADLDGIVNKENSEANLTSYMRQLITDNVSIAQNGERDTERPNIANTENMNHDEATTSSNGSCATTMSKRSEKTIVFEHIIDSLKSKLRQYEQQQQGKFKCLICLDDYRKPTISVSCWHVHCEDCWLRSLGARKLCPQCNLITTPKDLRRIYM